MSINIPDKIFKFLVLLGIFLIGYSFYDNDFSEKNYFTKIDKFNELNDSSAISKLVVDDKLENIKIISDNLALKYNIANQIIENKDSSVIFKRTLSGDSSQILVSDSLNKLWENYKIYSFKSKIMDEKVKQYSSILENEKNLNQSYHQSNDILLKIGVILFLLGIFMWVIDEPYDPKIVLVKINEKLYPYCQSCGKKFSAMRKYGKEFNGSDNLAFCEECYNEGKFTDDMTKEEFIEKSNAEIKKRNWFAKKILKSRFRNLDRWNKDRY